MSGYIVNQPQPHSAYAVSKAGVHHLARSMAGEWVGHNIRVNSISPGIMNTRLSGGPAQAELRRLWMEKSPMGIGDPEDLTGAVVLLCSDAGRFMTGIDIKIDGRWSGVLSLKLETDGKIRWVHYILRVALHINLPAGSPDMLLPAKNATTSAMHAEAADSCSSVLEHIR